MRGRRTLGRRRSADGFSRGQSRVTLVTFMFVVLAVAIVCTPFLMLGPHLTFSVSLMGKALYYSVRVALLFFRQKYRVYRPFKRQKYRVCRHLDLLKLSPSAASAS